MSTTPIIIIKPIQEFEGSTNPTMAPISKNNIPPAIRSPGGLSPINSKIALISKPIHNIDAIFLKRLSAQSPKKITLYQYVCLQLGTLEFCQM